MTKKRIYGLLFVFMICFIWGNSILSGDISGAISQFFADILGGEDGASGEEHYILRKLAHFSEFALLAVTANLFFGTLTSDRYRKYLSVACAGVFVPLADETIQIFSDRGYSLVDVWIDIAGYATGSLIIILFTYFLSRRSFVKDVHKADKSQ